MEQLPAELAGLPTPTIVEEIRYETALSLFIDRAVAGFAAEGVDYDVGGLETDPVVIIGQADAYLDTLLRQRINEAVRANFLAFATGSDIDHLAQFYDLSRLAGETDMALKRRVILAIRGRSPGGTEARYRSVALGADPRVADAAVYTVGRDATVRVAIFSTAADGSAGADLVAVVNAALQAPNVRMVNDRIVVTAAVKITVPVTADVWLLPDAPASTLQAMEANLRSTWPQEIGLGRDVTRAWLTSRMMVDGVHKVEIITPAADVDVPFDRAAAPGIVTLNLRGRLY